MKKAICLTKKDIRNNPISPGVKNNTSKSWQDIEETSFGMVSSFTFRILFLNDQIYAADMELNEILPKDKDLYRGEVRKTYDHLHQSIADFQKQNNSLLGKEASYFTANVLCDVEEDLKQEIDNMCEAVSQILMNAGVFWNTNAVASKAAILNLLCQISCLMIKEYGNRLLKYFGITDNALLPLSQEKQEMLSFNLMKQVIPKNVKLDLSNDNILNRAFDAFTAKMLYGSSFYRAIDRTEKELETV